MLVLFKLHNLAGQTWKIQDINVLKAPLVGQLGDEGSGQRWPLCEQWNTEQSSPPLLTQWLPSSVFTAENHLSTSKNLQSSRFSRIFILHFPWRHKVDSTVLRNVRTSRLSLSLRQIWKNHDLAQSGAKKINILTKKGKRYFQLYRTGAFPNQATQVAPSYQPIEYPAASSSFVA